MSGKMEIILDGNPILGEVLISQMGPTIVEKPTIAIADSEENYTCMSRVQMKY